MRLVLFHVSSHKTFRIKRFLARKQKQNRPIPHWIQVKTGHKIRYNSKRRHWRRTKLGLQGSTHERCSHIDAVSRLPVSHHITENNTTVWTAGRFI
ncbi:large ribosomal subunit protein eL39-like [Molossus nigricans]